MLRLEPEAKLAVIAHTFATVFLCLTFRVKVHRSLFPFNDPLDTCMEEAKESELETQTQRHRIPLSPKTFTISHEVICADGDEVALSL